MLRPPPRLHPWVLFFLAVGLPTAVAAGLLARRGWHWGFLSRKLSPPPAELARPSPPPIAAGMHRDERLALAWELWLTPKGRILELRVLESPREPELLAYAASQPAADGLPPSGIDDKGGPLLLGQLVGASPLLARWPHEPARNHLVIRGLEPSEVVASISLLPAEAEPPR